MYACLIKVMALSGSTFTGEATSLPNLCFADLEITSFSGDLRLLCSQMGKARTLS